MKFFIIFSLVIAQIIGAETFRCDIFRAEKSIYSDKWSARLEAVYLDGILRGKIIVGSNDAKEPNLGGNPNKATYIVAKSDGVVIKSVSGYMRQYAGKRNPAWNDDTDNYPYFYMLETDTFYMPLSKNELRAIRTTDSSGRKCLDVFYSSRP